MDWGIAVVSSVATCGVSTVLRPYRKRQPAWQLGRSQTEEARPPRRLGFLTCIYLG
jgi:hypothetical protein